MAESAARRATAVVFAALGLLVALAVVFVDGLSGSVLLGCALGAGILAVGVLSWLPAMRAGTRHRPPSGETFSTAQVLVLLVALPLAFLAVSIGFAMLLGRLGDAFELGVDLLVVTLVIDAAGSLCIAILLWATAEETRLAEPPAA